MHDPRQIQTPLAGVSLGEWTRALRVAHYRIRGRSRVMPAKARLEQFVPRMLHIEYRRWRRICKGLAAPDEPLVERIKKLHYETFSVPLRIVGRASYVWIIEADTF